MFDRLACASIGRLRILDRCDRSPGDCDRSPALSGSVDNIFKIFAIDHPALDNDKFSLLLGCLISLNHHLIYASISSKKWTSV